MHLTGYLLKILYRTHQGEPQIYNEIVFVYNFVFIVWLHAFQHVIFHFCLFISIPRSTNWVIHPMPPVYIGLLHAKTSFNELVPT